MARLRIQDHLLAQATWTPSPHASPRAEWADIELVVLHCISLPEGVYGQGVPERLFLGTLDTKEHPTFSDLAGVEVSAHLLNSKRFTSSIARLSRWIFLSMFHLLVHARKIK